MGYAGSSFGEVVDLEDAHFTPMNPEVSGKSYPDMYGVYIHANILSIMLADDYIKIMSPWLAWVLAFILCYLHMIIFAFYFNEKTKWMHLVAKIIQLTTSVLLLWIEFLVFQYYNYKIDMLPAIVAIILSVDILYFYEGIIAYLKKKTKIKSHFSKH
jgi:CHASE2 domain-containing sensor protein